MLNGRRRIRCCAALLVVALARPSLFAEGDQHGLVTFNGLPVPGATIIATQGDKKILAASDADGRYRLTGLGDGRVRGPCRDAWLRRAHARSRRRRDSNRVVGAHAAAIRGNQEHRRSCGHRTHCAQSHPMHPMHRTHLAPMSGSGIRAAGGRRIPRQRQRQQRRRVAVRSVARVRQQPSRPAFAVHRRIWFHVRHRRSGCAAVLVQRRARTAPRLYRHAVHGIDWRALQEFPA